MFESGDKKSKSLPEANPPAAGKDQADPADLLLTIAMANLVMLAGIIISLAVGYKRSQLSEMPLPFWVVFGAVIGIGLIASLSGSIAGGFTRAAFGISANLSLPEWLSKGLVYVLTIATIAALGYAVKATGGSAASPFTPFLTAPAVFAPFMARRWESIIIIGVAVIAAIWITDAGDSFASANPAVYSAVSTAFIVIAAIMSAIRHALGIDGHPPVRL